MIPLVTSAQMRALDEETITGLGIPGLVLMESAGRGVVDRLLFLHAQGQISLAFGHRVVVVCGPGNNGADGLVVARYLHTRERGRGASVEVLLCAESARLRGDAKSQLQMALAVGVPIHPVAGSKDGVTEVTTRLLALSKTDVIVDALFGTGLGRVVSGDKAEIIRAINSSPAVRVSVDLPSGLCADRGVPADAGHCEAPIVRADHTVTFAFPKIGLVGAPGFVYAGTVTVVDIGIPSFLCQRHGVSAHLLTDECLGRLSGKLDPEGHKGTHGHLLILAGSEGKTGAALLCSLGAQKTGVGLCTLAIPKGPAEGTIAGRVLEAMTASYELNQDESSLSSELRRLCGGKRALVIGPGLPAIPRDVLFSVLLENPVVPAVLDADALNVITNGGAGASDLRSVQRPLVLTPHPGEAARLLQLTPKEVNADRVGSARALAALTSSVVVLKGARTVIAAPPRLFATSERPIEAATVALCPAGNPAMGTGGMGDVLAGILGALLARGFAPFEAACTGVYLHARAGDLCAESTPSLGLVLASDVANHLALVLTTPPAKYVTNAGSPPPRPAPLSLGERGRG